MVYWHFTESTYTCGRICEVYHQLEVSDGKLGRWVPGNEATDLPLWLLFLCSAGPNTLVTTWKAGSIFAYIPVKENKTAEGSSIILTCRANWTFIHDFKITLFLIQRPHKEKKHCTHSASFSCERMQVL